MSSANQLAAVELCFGTPAPAKTGMQVCHIFLVFLHYVVVAFLFHVAGLNISIP